MKQLLSILLVGLVACANAQTTFGPVQHSNGVIIRPTNWAVLNSNAINSVIAGGGSGAAWISTNVGVSLTNLGLIAPVQFWNRESAWGTVQQLSSNAPAINAPIFARDLVYSNNYSGSAIPLSAKFEEFWSKEELSATSTVTFARVIVDPTESSAAFRLGTNNTGIWSGADYNSMSFRAGGSNVFSISPTNVWFFQSLKFDPAAAEGTRVALGAAEEGHEEHPVLSLPPYGGTLTPPPFGLTIWNDAGVLTVGGNGSNVAIPLTATTNASLLTSGTLADGLLSTNVVLRSTNGTANAAAWLLGTAPTNGVPTIATNQYGLGWDEDGRATFQTPVGPITVYSTGDPSTPTLYWPGTILAQRFDAIYVNGIVYASQITGGALGGSIADGVMRASMPEVLRNFQGGQLSAGEAGVPYILTNASMQPVPGTYVPFGAVITNGSGDLELTGQWAEINAFRTNVFEGGGIPTGATDGAVYQAQGGQGVFAAFQTAKFFDFTTNSGPSGAVVISNGTDFTRWRWSIPSWSTAQVIALACAGGGGGSGRRGAADTIAAGGGGGASGAVFAQFYTLPSGLTLDVTIGHGGSGGAAVTTDDTSGNAGSAAGPTLVKSTNSLASPGYFAFDPSWQTAGGGGGGGGTNAAAVGTKAGFLTPGYWLFVDGSAGQSGSVSTNAADGGTGPHAQSGRSGGSINAANQAFNGGRSFGTPTAYNTPYLFPFSQQTNTPFGNGAGGNASTTTNGQPGFNVPPLSGGGGGGGGGASRNGFNSGAGGKGGGGLVRIICF